ncbi:hypothetical protein ABIB90_003626 [Bradyrhizobium sp. JR4.1]|jgi:hypothetical protein|uniref:hypothetical protein n=1 Tax=unclassified Bradyrhizobium TaxID=2631580 RepID=UPI0033920B0B
MILPQLKTVETQPPILAFSSACDLTDGAPLSRAIGAVVGAFMLPWMKATFGPDSAEALVNILPITLPT